MSKAWTGGAPTPTTSHTGGGDGGGSGGGGGGGGGGSGGGGSEGKGSDDDSGDDDRTVLSSQGVSCCAVLLLSWCRHTCITAYMHVLLPMQSLAHILSVYAVGSAPSSWLSDLLAPDRDEGGAEFPERKARLLCARGVVCGRSESPNVSS